MRQGPARISQIILNGHGLDAPPKPLVEILTDIILVEKWEANSSDARERAESWVADTKSRLVSEVNSLLDLGRPPRIAFNSSSDYMIQGACFIEGTDPEDIREQKIRRLRSLEYFTALMDLTWEEFERLCGKIMSLLKVQNPIVTPRASDEGIDFYGQLSFESIFFPEDLNPTIQKQLTIWLIGQAKHYQKTTAGTSDIRNLVGAIALGRANAYSSSRHPYPDLRIRVGDPIFALFITTGTLSGRVWELLKKSGIIGIDGEMLAAFLADRSVGVENDKFEKKAFLKWLHS